jgi:tetratricopeptide (TPR) repeat protein
MGVTVHPHILGREELAGYPPHADRILSAVSALASEVSDAISPSREAWLSPTEAALVPQLDTARDLLRAGKTKSALDLLEQLEAAFSATTAGVSSKSRYRLALNHGSALLDSGRPADAIAHYNRALELQPNDPAALFSLAKARLALDQPALALELSERALAKDPADLKARAMQLLALHSLDRDQDVDQIVDASPALVESSLGSAMLGEIRLTQGRYEEAVPLLRRGLASEEVRLPRLRMLIAVGMVRSLEASTDLSTGISPEEDVREASLREALGLFDQAVDGMESSDDRDLLLETIASRAGVKALLGDRVEALQDLDRVLSENPTHALAIGNLSGGSWNRPGWIAERFSDCGTDKQNPARRPKMRLQRQRGGSRGSAFRNSG